MQKCKQICGLAVILTLLICTASVTAFATDNEALYLSAPEKAAVGESAKINVNTDTGGITMIQFALRYDSEKLQIISAVPGSIVSGNAAPIINSQNDGVIYFVWDSLNPIEKSGTLLEVTFTTKGNVGDVASLWFDQSEDLVVTDSSMTSFEVFTGIKDIRLVPSEEAPTETAGEPPQAMTGSNNGITLSQNDLTLSQNDSSTLSITDSDEDVSWESSNDDVASVDENGNITAHKSGTAIITATSLDGSKSSSCFVTVAVTSAQSEFGFLIYIAIGAAAAAIILYVIYRVKLKPVNKARTSKEAMTPKEKETNAAENEGRTEE